MKNSLWMKILTVIGTVLVWIPPLAPFFFGLASLALDGVFHFDYLMPAEFGLLAIAGAVILVIAAILARSPQLKVVGWGIGVAVVSIVGGQVIASVTGLASGLVEPTGWQWALVLASLAIYVVALIVIGVGGVLLTRDLFRARAAGAA